MTNLNYNQKQLKQIVEKFIAGNCSDSEKMQLKSWIDDGKNEPSLTKIIDELLANELYSYDVVNKYQEDQIWERIYADLKSKSPSTKFPKDVKSNTKRFARQIQFKKWAAVLVLLICVGVVARYFLNNQNLSSNQSQAALQWIIKTSNPGEKVQFSLPDGTLVKLNANSNLRYNDNFNLKERKVFLSGEAYFDVKRNENKPFTVFSGDIQTKVLGTSFNVKSISSSEVSIAVTSGNVLVQNEDGSNNIALRKGEMTRIDAQEEIWAKTKFDYRREIGWKDGILVFSNERFDQILTRLQYWYAVDFEVHGNANPDILINTTYDNDPLDRILNGLSFTYGFNYEIQGKRVIIKF